MGFVLFYFVWVLLLLGSGLLGRRLFALLLSLPFSRRRYHVRELQPLVQSALVIGLRFGDLAIELFHLMVVSSFVKAVDAPCTA